MTTTTDALREIVCSNCGEPLGEYSRTERTKVGRCCFNLPDPWELSSTSPGDDAGYEEEECGCWDCRYENGVLDRYDFSENDSGIAEFTEYMLRIHGGEPSPRDVAYFEQLSS